MKTKNITVESSKNELLSIVTTDEFITDFSFQYQMFQLNLMFNLDDDNNGFCLES